MSINAVINTTTLSVIPAQAGIQNKSLILTYPNN